MKIAIFGSGGVGGYFGARLAQSGLDVIFIARGRHLEAMLEYGLKIESDAGDFVLHPVNATDDPSKVGKVDAVVLGVKAWQVSQAANEMAPMIASETFVLPLQNGVEAADQLAQVIGREHVLGGLCRIISFLAAPGVIRHAGFEPKIIFGELDNHPSDRTEKLRRAFEYAGVNIYVAPDIQAALWSKFLFIAPYSGMGAVTRMAAGVMRRLPETRELIEDGMREVFQVARASKISLPEDTIEKSMAGLDSLPEDATSSMQRDLMEGRPSELSSQNGAVVRLGNSVGVETPINKFIYNCLLPSELKARGDL